MIVQPESWFELGNPNLQTVCIDLAYRLPGGGYPIFTSGDDESGSPPRIIARSFEEWFLELLAAGRPRVLVRPGFPDFGDPWQSHRRHAPEPALPDRLRRSPTALPPLIAHRRRRAQDRRAAWASAGPTSSDLPPLQHVSSRSRFFAVPSGT